MFSNRYKFLRTVTTFLLGSLVVLVTHTVDAESIDVQNNPERVADLTSNFLDLNFLGSIAISDLGDECVYKIPLLRIQFVKVNNRLTKSIPIDGFRVAVFDSKKNLLSENRYPITIDLPSPGAEAKIEDFIFKIPKTILKNTDYIALTLTGRFILQDDGRYKDIDPLKKNELFVVGQHAMWPITAISNVLSQKSTGDDQEHMVRQWRLPDNPNDYCSSAKLH